MKNFKKILSLVLALVMIASTFITANATDVEIIAEGQCGENVYWKITSDGLLDIYGEGDMYEFTNIDVPSYYDYREYFNQVKFEEGVTSVGGDAFGVSVANSDIMYDNITKAPVFADSIKSIGSYAFSKCPNMAGDIKLPENLEIIYSCAFQGCGKLTGDLIIPDSVKEIRYAAFYACLGFDGVLKLSNSLEVLGSLAFTSCHNLKGDLVIPEKVKVIPYATFLSCLNLDGNLVLSSGLEEIGERAFYSCYKMNGTLEIPETVSKIGKCAFHGTASKSNPNEFFKKCPDYFSTTVEDDYNSTVIRYYCTDCGSETNKEVHYHSYDILRENVIEATSFSDGSYDTVLKCNVCGKEGKRITVINHCSFSDRHENDINSGINFSFDVVSRCDDCNEEITRHTTFLSKYDAVEPTKESAGNVEYYIDGDGVKYVYEDNVYKYIPDASVSYCSVNGHTESAPVKDNIVSEKDCKTDGIYDFITKCEVCGEELSRKTVTENASGHNPSTSTVENYVEATETSDGNYNEVVHCKDCGEILSSETKTVHFPDEITMIENCVIGENNSFELVTYCKNCGEEISRITVELSKVEAVEPTKTTAGSVEYFTDGNGNKYVIEDDKFTEKSDVSISYCEKFNHVSGEAVKENLVENNSCTVNDEYESVIYCSVCGEELSREKVIVDAKDHTPMAAKTENLINATEGADGSFDEVIYCEDCGIVISAVTKAIHLPDEKTVIENATVSENSGSFEIVIYCKNCNEELSRTVINLTKVDAVEPTKETAGSIEYFIDDNGNKYVYENETFTVTESTSISFCEANGHTESEAVLDNIISEKDCVTDGIYDKVVVCEVCNKELSRETITDKATGHNPSTSTVENYVGASNTSDGSFDEVTYCKDCGEVIEKITNTVHSDEVIYRTENDIISDTENSFELITLCMNCEEELSREVITLTKVDVKEPTENELGNAEHYEDKDGNEFIIVDGKFVQVENTIITFCEHFGHSKSEAVVENKVGSQSCTESETYESVIYCSVCGEEISRDKVTEKATGHDKSEPIIVTIKEANCCEKGSHIETVYCKTCGEKVSETTVTDPVTEHNWGEGNVVSGEYDKNTVEEFTCSDCGEKKVEISKNPNYQFRCKRCDWYDSKKGSNPILYFIYTIVHSITHFVQSINHAT